MSYRELRDQNNKLIAKYDPERRLLQIKQRGAIKLFDLRAYDDKPFRERPERPPERN